MFTVFVMIIILKYNRNSYHQLSYYIKYLAEVDGCFVRPMSKTHCCKLLLPIARCLTLFYKKLINVIHGLSAMKTLIVMERM